jgi:hypothetical protein
VRTQHYKLIALVFVVQLLLMLALDTWGRNTWGWVERVSFFGTYVIPFIAYLVFLYGAPMFARMSSVPKMICLTLMSYGMTMAGTMLILVLWFVVSMITGLPIRR